jgi:hypothetical protein
MFKSKHSGWTYDLKRTPFGGGGFTNFLAEIDPVEAFKGAANSMADEQFRQSDWVSENGWILPVALATFGYAAGAAVGEGAVAGAGGATAADGTIFAAGEAIPAGTTLSGGTAVGAAGEGALTTSEVLGSSGFTPSAGSSFVIEPGTAYTTGSAAAGGGASAITPTSGADAVLNSPTQISNLTPPGAGNFGTITPPLEGSGAIPGAGALTNASGLTGAMPAGVMVGDGTLGTTIGQSYMAAAPGQFALNASGAAIPAGASGIAGTVPSSGLSASDILNNVKRAKNLSDALKQGASSGLSNSLGQLAQGANPQGQALGAAVRGNPNPFTFSPQQPIQDAKPLDLASLANLLKQG